MYMYMYMYQYKSVYTRAHAVTQPGGPDCPTEGADELAAGHRVCPTCFEHFYDFKRLQNCARCSQGLVFRFQGFCSFRAQG